MPSDGRAGGWVVRDGSHAAEDGVPPPGASRAALFAQILGAAVRALSRRMETVPEPTPPLARRAAGCLMPLLLLFLFVCIAVVGVVYLFGQTLLEGWTPY